MSKIKIEDIARESGFSLATVSRYFNKPELLSDSTRKKIEDIIKKLNYSQNNLARMLVTGESDFVGVILPHLQLGFYSELLNQLIEQGKALGYKFIVYTSNESKESELELINDLISYRIKGLILLSHLLDSNDIEALPVPVISIERAGGNFMQIDNDNFTGGKLAGELLLKNNCDVFIHINDGYFEELPSFNRIIGFEITVKDRPYELIVETKLSMPHSPEAENAMESLMNNILKKYPNKKIGIFCSNDDIANLVLKYSIKNNIAIPDTVELIGYDNSPVSDYAVYPITSIEQNMPLMAQISLDALSNYKPYKSIVPAKLIRKQTTS